jgi:hypothetical protein
VQGRQFGADGIPIGSPFFVSVLSNAGGQRVAYDAVGDFVVIWQSDESVGADTSGLSVQGQRYYAGGLPKGSPFQVNTYMAGDQTGPSIASDSAGNFVVVWERGDGLIEAQRYAASGSPIGSEFAVAAATGHQFAVHPTVASDSGGDHVVVWESRDDRGSGYPSSIRGQRYTASGSPVGGSFQINTYSYVFPVPTPNPPNIDQVDPWVASTSCGAFVVVWTSTLGSPGNDTSGSSVQGQVYNASGSAVGGQFQVNTDTTGNQQAAGVASDAAGHNFVAVWNSIDPYSIVPSSSVRDQRYVAGRGDEQLCGHGH